MNEPMSEKEKLLTMLNEVYDQLEELESVLEASFSDLRLSLNEEEKEKLSISRQDLTAIDKKLTSLPAITEETISDSNRGQAPQTLKLELGF